MKIIKRSGEEVVFDRAKIELAITRANEDCGDKDKKELTKRQIEYIGLVIEEYCSS